MQRIQFTPVTKCLTLVMMLLLSELAVGQEERTFIERQTYRAPHQTETSVPADDVTKTIQYFDKLGRPEQMVINRFTPNGNDLVNIFTYDELGRSAKEYLPYAATTNDGLFKPNALSDQANFSRYNGEPAYAERRFENNALGRVLEQGAPGDSWSLVGGATVKTSYGTNGEDEVIHLDESTLLTQGLSYYAPNTLMVNRITDEEDHVMIQYVDKRGRTVKKRFLLEAGEVADTYYLYDELDQLKYVIPPEAARSLKVSFFMAGFDRQDFLDQWAFQYEYDGRNRMTAKKVPGADWVRMIYDDRDRLVLIRDGNQYEGEYLNFDVVLDDQSELKTYEVLNKTIELNPGFELDAALDGDFEFVAYPEQKLSTWLFTKYDELNRPIMTGITRRSGRYEDVVAEVETFYGNGGAYAETIEANGPLFTYSNTTFPVADGTGPSIAESDLLKVTYYDNYDFTTVQPPAGVTTITKPTGQVTGTLTRVLETEDWLLTVTFYDERYRPVKVVIENYVGGQDVIETTYRDIVSSQVESTKLTHTGGETLEIVDDFTYDHQDRLLQLDQRINGGSPTTIAHHTYNEIGELVSKDLGGIGAAAAQTVDFEYNIRGWLTRINGGTIDEVNSNDKFAMELFYDNASVGFEQYNGNIGRMSWQSLGGLTEQNVSQSYDFKYDKLNRLTSAIYSGVGNHSVPNIKYDLNGNIKSLERYKKIGTLNAQIDKLSYNYQNGNQLSSVDDDGEATSHNVIGDPKISMIKDLGFFDKTTPVDFGYDDNGNMVLDRNKSISSIQYNFLNLPSFVTFENGNTVKYTYDAAGVKLRKEATTGANTKTSDYVGGIHYVDQALTFFQHPEGRVIKNASAFDYEYNLTDHLGNVRVTVDGAGEVVQRDDYYPFGLTFNSSSIARPDGNGGESLYKYNSVEQDPNSGNYEMTFRGYQTELGKFMQIDPLAVLIPSHDPYHFGFNNPVMFNDPLGLMGECGTCPKNSIQEMAQVFNQNAMLTGTGDGSGRNFVRTQVSINGKAVDDDEELFRFIEEGPNRITAHVFYAGYFQNDSKKDSKEDRKHLIDRFFDLLPGERYHGSEVLVSAGLNAKIPLKKYIDINFSLLSEVLYQQEWSNRENERFVISRKDGKKRLHNELGVGLGQWGINYKEVFDTSSEIGMLNGSYPFEKNEFTFTYWGFGGKYVWGTEGSYFFYGFNIGAGAAAIFGANGETWHGNTLKRE